MVSILIGLIWTLFAQQSARDATSVPATAMGAIGGTVMIEGTPARPARRATVTLIGGAFPNGQIAITNDEGRFVFEGLTAGRYTLAASKPTYVTAYFGSPRAGRGPGRPIALADRQRVTDIAIRMLPGAVVSGVTYDALGRPEPLSNVLLLESRVAGADRSLVFVAATRADSQGAYRFAGLPPGSYTVCVRPPLNFSGAHVPTPQEFSDLTTPAPTPARNVTYAPTFPPATADAAAALAVNVAAGEEHAGLDINLQFVPSARLAGRVVDPDGRPPQALQLSMISPAQRLGFIERDISGMVRPNAVVAAQDGVFDRPALTPGHYTFFARASPGLWGIADVEINGQDVSDFVIALQRGMTVLGRLTLDGDRVAAPLELSTVELKLSPVGMGMNLGVQPVRAGIDGTFAFRGVAPGDYLVSAAPGGGWFLKGVDAGSRALLERIVTVSAGQDLGDLTLTLGDRPASLSGMLVDALGRPAPESVIVVFSADRLFWTPQSIRTRQVHPATDGRYVFPDLPPGDYLVVAVTDVQLSELDDPRFLETLAPAAAHVSVADAERKVLNLRIGG